MSRRSFVAVALYLLLGAGAEGQEPLAVVPLHPYAGALKTVTVRIGETENPFLFDTGGGATCVTPELAAELGCTPFGRASGFRLNGERVDFEWCEDMTIDVGGVSLPVEISVFDILALLGDAPPVGGLVSVHTFASQPFTLDLDNNQLILESEESLAARSARTLALSARFAHQAGGASLDPFVEVRAKRGTLWLELDSGNIGRTLLAPHARDQLGLATTEDQVTALDLVGFGPIDLEVRFLETCIYDGVLGVEFFEGRTITFDAANDRIWGSRVPVAIGPGG